LPLAYCTTGQEVPDDIERVRPDVLARLVLEREAEDV
jgi:flagellar biosynthesis GTPase FlhF